MDGCPTFAPAYSGFPVELAGVDELHAAFLNESRTRGCWWRPVQEIRIRGPKTSFFRLLYLNRPQIPGAPHSRFPVKCREFRELHAPFLKERRTRGLVQGCVQEIRGISLVFREMWDTTALNRATFNKQLITLRNAVARQSSAELYASPADLAKQEIVFASHHAKAIRCGAPAKDPRTSRTQAWSSSRQVAGRCRR
jgi:hypothetical protein